MLRGGLGVVLLAGCVNPKDRCCGLDTGPTDTDADADADADADTDTDADGDTDTDTTAAETCGGGNVVLFEHEDGSRDDVTAGFLDGTYQTFDAPGRLLVCPGVWYARLLIRAPVDVVGLGADPSETTLSGGESGTVLDVSGKGNALTVSNLTIDRGEGLDKAHNSGGGGIYCEDFATVDVDGVSFTHNFANDGSALYATDCHVSVLQSVFADNVSEDDGGAVTLWYSEGVFEDVRMVGNVSLDGGAMAIFYSTASFTRASFEDNVATSFSGGIWVYYSDITMSQSLFARNDNPTGQAGGLFVYGTAYLDRVNFTDNVARMGGALFSYYDATVQGTACDFVNNTPDDVYQADYTSEGGVSYVAGSAATFTCEGNVCYGL